MTTTVIAVSCDSKKVYNINQKKIENKKMNAFFSVLHLPGLLLNIQKLKTHPGMASAGIMANSVMIWQQCCFEDHVLDVLYKVSIAVFLHSFHQIFGDDNLRQSSILKYMFFASIVWDGSSFSDGILYVYAAYVASLAPCFAFHVYYICFHAVFNFVEQLHVFTHVCMFFLMTSAYQIADICDFIRDEAMYVSG